MVQYLFIDVDQYEDYYSLYIGSSIEEVFLSEKPKLLVSKRGNPNVTKLAKVLEHYGYILNW